MDSTPSVDQSSAVESSSKRNVTPLSAATSKEASSSDDKKSKRDFELDDLTLEAFEVGRPTSSLASASIAASSGSRISAPLTTLIVAIDAAGPAHRSGSYVYTKTPKNRS